MATTAREERLDVRLPRDQKQIIERAACHLGQTKSQFIRGTVLRYARKVLRDQAVIELSNRDRDRVLAALADADLEPSPELRRAFERRKRLLG